jgi:glycosyltransferase involved in cell wall biosynthesis
MDPQFALSFAGRLSDELSATGVRVHQLGEVRTRKPWTIKSARTRLRELLSAEPFDIVVCHMPWPMAIFGKAVRGSNSHLAFWAHDAANGRHWLERWASRIRPDVVIGNSLFTKTTVPALFPDAPCRIVHYPVMPPRPDDVSQCRANIRREFGVSDDTVVIVQVSRMEAWKGHYLHLEALSRLKDQPCWTCWMVGGAQRPKELEYVRSLQRTAAELGIAERVRFLGQRSDVHKVLAAADVFCQPNMGPEPFGIVFIEALAAGLPVVTTDLGAAKEIIDDSCGIIVPPKDPDQLARSLELLIESAELRARLGRGGPERALRICDPSARIQDLYEVLRRAASN